MPDPYNPSMEEIRTVRESARCNVQIAKDALAAAEGDIELAQEYVARRRVPVEDRVLMLEIQLARQSSEIAALREMVDLFVPKPV